MESRHNNPVFSIIIPTWNNLSYLQVCINAIKKNSSFNHQIIVFVNEGNDGTLDWLKTQPDIAYLHSPQNAGICHALNRAAQLAKTDYIAYLNDDMYVCLGWDQILMEEISKIGHDNFYISSTLIEPYHTNNNCVIVADYGKSIETFKEHDLNKNFSSHAKNNWNGATWPPSVVHKKNWEAVGGLSLEFSPGMYSDPDFSMKLWKLGIRIFLGVGNSRVYHFVSKSTNKIRKKSFGSEIFLIKWGITSRTFYRYYLKMGEHFTAYLSEPKIPLGVTIKNKLKRLYILITKGNIYKKHLFMN